MDIKVIVGSSYGDEGKGLATNYFSDNNTLNVLYNGGPQRGHTVELLDGTRHVFHHFGSGTFKGADTYFDEDFLVNPADFVREYNELKSLGYNPKVFISSKCRVITLYDIMINQIIEKARGNDRNGSCGMGIWETIDRYNKTIINDRFGVLVNGVFDDDQEEIDQNLLCFVESCREYVTERFEGIEDSWESNALTDEYAALTGGVIPPEYQELLDNEDLVSHYLNDFEEMKKIVTIVDDYKELFKNYNNIVFEGAQGLRLSEDNTVEAWHTTASLTGSKIPMERIKDLNYDSCEVVYITRSYITRHGAGNLEGECNKSEINPDIIDKTNEPNDYQGSIRYAKMNLGKLIHYITDDEKKSGIFNNPKVNKSIFITHLNYTNNMIGKFTVEEFKKEHPFYKVYCSDNKYGANKILN